MGGKKRGGTSLQFHVRIYQPTRLRAEIRGKFRVALKKAIRFKVVVPRVVAGA